MDVRGKGLIVALVTAALVLAGCSDTGDKPDVPTVTPQTPIAAPADDATRPPAGSVVAVPDAGTALAFCPSTSQLALLSDDGKTVLFYPTAGLTPGVLPSRSVALPDKATGFGSFSGGKLQVLIPGALLTIDSRDGQVRRTDMPGVPLSAVLTSTGEVFVGTDGGDVLRLDAQGVVRQTINGLVRVDAIAEHDGQVVVLDRAQSSVTQLDLADGDLGVAIRSGDGATNLTVDHFGRFLTTDTRGGEVLAFNGDPLVNKFRYPVAFGPYAVDYDDTHNLAWVSTTGNNKVTAYELSSGTPVQQRQFETVGQANSMVVDPKTGTVYLLSARGEGLQIIEPDQQ
jgi:sugar lactone lactonase YvrE